VAVSVHDEANLGRLQVRLRARWSDAAIVGAATAVGTVLRFAHLSGHDGVTGDEGITLALAQHSFGRMLHLFTFEANGLIYSLVEWPLIRVFSESLFMLRLPAALAGIAMIPALYWAARRFAGRSSALIAAALLAINPLAVSYSQLAKPYSFAMLFGVVAFGCLARVDDDRRWWIGYVAAMTLAAYSHTTALALLLAQAVLVPRGQWRRWLVSLGALLVTIVPLVALLAAEHSKQDGLYWLDRPSIFTGLDVARDFASGLPGLVLSAVVVVAAIFLRRRDRAIGVAAAWALLPPAALFLVAQVKPIFWIGYVLPALPGALLLIAVAVTRLPRPVAVAVPILLVGIFAFRAVHEPGFYHVKGAELAARTLASAHHDGTVVFDIPAGLGAVGFYDHAMAPDGHLIESEWGDAPPAGVTLLDDPGGYGRAPDGPPTAQLIARLARETGTVFLLFTETTRQGDVVQSPGLRWAAKACKLTAAWEGGFRVVRVTGCPAPS
jgi:4-amino-4-deoxy-L-arabinose transferase-like glycosyltransferase